MSVHIAAGLTPLPMSNAPVLGMCGKTVANPYPEMMVEVGSRGLPQRNPMRDCAECWKLAEKIEVPDGERYYFYWLFSVSDKRKAAAEQGAVVGGEE